MANCCRCRQLVVVIVVVVVVVIVVVVAGVSSLVMLKLFNCCPNVLHAFSACMLLHACSCMHA